MKLDSPTPRGSSRQSARRRRLSDLLLVWLGTIVAAFAGLLSQMILARTLGSDDYGTLSGALALVTLAVPVGVFGTSEFWLKAFGEEGWAARRWIRSSFRFLGLSTSLITITLVLWAVFGPHDGRSQFVLLTLLTTLVAMISVEIVVAKLQLEQRYASVSAISAIVPLSRLVASLAVLVTHFRRDELYFVALGLMVGSLIIIALLIPKLRELWSQQIDLRGHQGEPINTALEEPPIGMLLSQSWVFGLAGLFYLAWAQGHVVIAKYALGSVEAGAYNAALVVLTAVCLLPSVTFSRYLLPKIYRWAAQDFNKLRHFSRIASVSMFGIGLVVASLVYLFAPTAIRLSFGPGYEQAVTVLRALSFAIPMRFLGYTAGAMLRTRRFMRIKIMLLATAVLINLALASVFLPIWGVEGLAATVAITEFILFSAYAYIAEFHYLRRHT